MEPDAKAKLDTALAHLKQGALDDAIAQLNEVLAASAASGDAEAEMFASGLLAPALANKDAVDEARTHAQRALTLANTLNDAQGRTAYEALVAQLSEPAGQPLTEDGVNATFDAAVADLDRGAPQAAVDRLAPLIAAAQRERYADLEASARGMTADALIMLRDVEGARTHGERALQIAVSLGDEGAAAHFRGILETLQADDGAGVEQAAALAMIAALGETAMEAAGAAFEAEDPHTAITALKPAIAAAAAGGGQATEATLRGMLAQALVMAGSREEGAEQAQKALDIAKALGDEDAIVGFGEILKNAIGWATPIEDA